MTMLPRIYLDENNQLGELWYRLGRDSIKEIEQRGDLPKPGMRVVIYVPGGGGFEMEAVLEFNESSQSWSARADDSTLLYTTFGFGPIQSNDDGLEIQVVGYSQSPSGAHPDDNLLTTQIRIRGAGLQSDVDTAILADHLPRLLEGLRVLHSTLRGDVEFTTLQEELRFKLSGDGTGNFVLTGEMTDKTAIGNRLNFHLEFDQRELGFTIIYLEGVVESFPVRRQQEASKE